MTPSDSETHEPAASAGNRTLERTAAILDALGTEASSASELARRTGLSVSTVHRLALSMTTYGFLQRNEIGLFTPGVRFIRSALEANAAPLLEKLRDETGETCQLWIRRGDGRICLVSADSKHELRATLPVGTTLPLAMGGSAAEVVLDSETAREQLGRYGWVESVSLRTPGLGSVSAPVTIADKTVGAVCLALPLARSQDSPGQDFGDRVIQAAQRLAHITSGHIGA